MEELQQALTDRSLSIIDKLKVACYIWKNTGDTRNMLRWSCDQISSIYKKKSSSNEECIVQLFKFLSVLLKTYTSVGKWCPDDSVFTVHLFEVKWEVDSSKHSWSHWFYMYMYTEYGHCSPSGWVWRVYKEYHWKLTVHHDRITFALCSIQVWTSGDSQFFFCYTEWFSACCYCISQVSLLHSLLLNLGTAISVLVSVEPFFRFFVYLLESQGKQKKVFTVTCEELLEPLLKARKVLTADKAVCSPSSTEILAHLDNIIKQVFNKYVTTKFGAGSHSRTICTQRDASWVPISHFLSRLAHQLS